MGSDAEAQAAVEGMNGQSLGGRSLVVNEARPMETRPPRTGGFGGGRREGGSVVAASAAVAKAAATATAASAALRQPGWSPKAANRGGY